MINHVEHVERVEFLDRINRIYRIEKWNVSNECGINGRKERQRVESVWRLRRDHETAESMSRLTATWRCRVRTLPRFRRAVRTRHRQPCGSHRFAGHECPPARDTNKHEPL